MEVFVDNLFVLLCEEEQILQAADQICAIFGKNAFPLHELASNSKEANLNFTSKGLSPASPIVKTLGLFWQTDSDNWSINKPDFITDNASKRSILSDLAKVFDPLGFYAILTIQGRLILQETYDSIWKWDGILPQCILSKWSDLVSSLSLALSTPVPRWVGTDIRSTGTISIHCFTDASDRALGCVIYLVQKSLSRFYTAKPKLCPTKFDHYSIPRKELTAISIGIRYLKFVINSISKYIIPSSVHLWSDSTTALTWCISKHNIKELFIRARVEHLQSTVKQYNIKLHYVISQDNPADHLTKITKIRPHDKAWVEGPELLKTQECWKEFTKPLGRKDTIPVFQGDYTLPLGPEALTRNPSLSPLAEPFVTANSNNQSHLGIDINIYEDLDQLYKDTALLTHKEINPNSLKSAKISWIKFIQKQHFADIITFLENLKGHLLKSYQGKMILRKEKLVTPTQCLNLHLFLDNNRIIRVLTSVAEFDHLSYDQRNPIFLPPKSKFVFLLVKNAHIMSGHLGQQATISNLRRNFWITRCSSVVSKVLESCNTCIKQRGKRYHYSGKTTIPEFRADVDHPFRSTAVDMSGHYFVKDYSNKKKEKNKSNNENVKKEKTEDPKCYLIIFVCMATGCGDVEVVQSASSEAFSEALERFFCRRGVPELIVSDNGSNFKGYFPELKRISDSATIKNNLIQKGIQWKWVPVSAPSFNGFAERSVGLIKGIIKRSVGNKILTFSQLRTVCSYAEAVFNSRPLHVLSSSDPDFIPITPNMLVYGDNLRILAHDMLDIDLNDPDFKTNNKDLNVMARKLRDTLASVRKRFKSDYFNFLTQKDSNRSKSSPFSKSPILPKVDHYVLIKDDNTSDLKIGKIIEVLPSSDNEIRQVMVKTAHSTGIFPTFN